MERKGFYYNIGNTELYGDVDIFFESLENQRRNRMRQTFQFYCFIIYPEYIGQTFIASVHYNHCNFSVNILKCSRFQ
jgi:hypothetical protein